MTDCEKIASTSTHIVYKCPSSLEWIKDVKAQQPTGKWVDTSGIDETKLSEMASLFPLLTSKQKDIVVAITKEFLKNK